jgi:hypothetical protein
MALLLHDLRAFELPDVFDVEKRRMQIVLGHCAPFHLFRYLDDQSYRFNERKQDDQGRFLCAISTAKDKTLTWKRLTGKPAKK